MQMIMKPSDFNDDQYDNMIWKTRSQAVFSAIERRHLMTMKAQCDWILTAVCVHAQGCIWNSH